MGAEAHDVAVDVRDDEVHRGRADELGDEEVDRLAVEVLRRVELLQLALAHHGDRSPSVIASDWSWVT